MKNANVKTIVPRPSPILREIRAIHSQIFNSFLYSLRYYYSNLFIAYIYLFLAILYFFSTHSGCCAHTILSFEFIWASWLWVSGIHCKFSESRAFVCMCTHTVFEHRTYSSICIISHDKSFEVKIWFFGEYSPSVDCSVCITHLRICNSKPNVVRSVRCA